MAEPSSSARARGAPGGSAATADPSSSGAPVLAEVFLSPRVIDREAFNDFSASLRRLIEQAGEQAGALRTASEAAAGAQQAIKDLSGKNQPRLEAAVKALTLLDQRAQDAERLVQAAQGAAAALETLRREGQDLVTQRRQELGERADELAQSLERRFTELEARAEAATRRQSEAVEARIAQAEARLTRKSAEIDAWAADVLRRAERQVDGEQQRAQATGQELIRQTADAHAQAQAIAAELSALIARAEALVSDRGEASLRAAITDASAVYDRVLGSITRLEALASTHAPATTADADTSYPSPIARPLSPSASAPSDLSPSLDHLSEVAERLRESVQRTLDLCGAAEERLTLREAEFKAALREPIRDLQDRSAQVQRELSEVMGRIEHERTMAGSLSDQSAAVLRHLSALVREIEPWKPILLGGVTRGELPAPLSEAVQQARAALAADVQRVSALLSRLMPEG